jgi:hypothetical protein
MAKYYSKEFLSKTDEAMEEEQELAFKEGVFTDEILNQAIRETNFNKALGEDWMCGLMLTNEKVGPNLRS